MSLRTEINRIKAAKEESRLAIISKGVQVSTDLTVDYYAEKILQIYSPPKTPVFNISSGTYNTAQTVTIFTGGTIYYTTNGTQPTTSSTEYTVPIQLSTDGTYCIKAIGVNEDGESYTGQLDVVIALTPQAPTFNVEDGDTITEILDFEIYKNAADTSGTIYYTTNGDTPTSSSDEYTEPIRMKTNGDYTIKAIVIKNGTLSGPVATVEFTIDIAATANIIYYTAAAKLPETTGQWDSGLHTNAFGDATMLEHNFADGVGEVIFDRDVTIIGTAAFRYTRVITVTLPDTVETIQSQAFISATYLTELRLPDSVVTLSGNALQGCTGLRAIYAGVGLQTASNNIIQNTVNSIQVIDINVNNPYLGSHDPNGNNCNVIADKINHFILLGCVGSDIETMTDIQKINTGAFRQVNGLTSLTFPSSLKWCDSMSFQGCTTLTEININKGIIALYGDTFNTCTAITTFNYDGTMEEWSHVNHNGEQWHQHTPATGIQCTDGFVTFGS